MLKQACCVSTRPCPCTPPHPTSLCRPLRRSPGLATLTAQASAAWTTASLTPSATRRTPARRSPVSGVGSAPGGWLAACSTWGLGLQPLLKRRPLRPTLSRRQRRCCGLPLPRLYLPHHPYALTSHKRIHQLQRNWCACRAASCATPPRPTRRPWHRRPPWPTVSSLLGASTPLRKRRPRCAALCALCGSGTMEQCMHWMQWSPGDGRSAVMGCGWRLMIPLHLSSPPQPPPTPCTRTVAVSVGTCPAGSTVHHMPTHPTPPHPHFPPFPQVLRVWARVLLAVPGSRLVLKNKPFACEVQRLGLGLAVGWDGR